MTKIYGSPLDSRAALRLWETEAGLYFELNPFASKDAGRFDVLGMARRRAFRLAAMRAQRRPGRGEAATIRKDVMQLARSWRQVLAEDPDHWRPIVSSLLIGRVTITPAANSRQWELRGEGTFAGLFSKTIFPSGWCARQDSNLRPTASKADALSN